MKTSWVGGIAVKIIFVMILALLCGCATPQRTTVRTYPQVITIPAPRTQAEPEPQFIPEPPVAKAPEFYVHLVRWQGETLSKIAAWYTGSQKNWKHIVDVNAELEPKLIHIGDEILIPIELLKTTNPMTREFLIPSVTQKQASPRPKKKHAVKTTQTIITKPPQKNTIATKSIDIELFELQDIKEPTPDLGEIELFEPIE